MLRTPLPKAVVAVPAAACGALALAGPALAPLAEGLFYQPKAETVLERTTVWTAKMATVEVEMLENGEPSANAPGVYTDVDSELSVTTVDRVVRAATNRPLEFVRTFDDITLEMGGGLGFEADGQKMPLGGEGESELDQLGVKFVYDEDKGAWEKSYAEDYEGMAELLEPLRADTEYIALLPEDAAEVEIGDQWDVELDVLDEMIAPGGDLSIALETEFDAIEGVLDPMRLPGPFQLLDGDRSGDVTAKLKSLEDGAATVEVRFELEIASDQTEVYELLIDGALPDGASASIEKASYVLGLEGEATLVWDVEAYHARSFDLEAEVTIEVEVGAEVDVGGGSGLYEMNESREGELAVRMALGE